MPKETIVLLNRGYDSARTPVPIESIAHPGQFDPFEKRLLLLPTRFGSYRQTGAPLKQETSCNRMIRLPSLIPVGKAKKAGAGRLLDLNQKHWYVENRPHYRKDKTLGEDASQVRLQGAPQTLATMNGGILALMDWLGVTNMASQMRHFCAQPQ